MERSRTPNVASRGCKPSLPEPSKDTNRRKSSLQNAQNELSGGKGFWNGVATGITFGIYNPLKENLDKARGAVDRINSEIKSIDRANSQLIASTQQELEQKRQASGGDSARVDGTVTGFQNAVNQAQGPLSRARENFEKSGGSCLASPRQVRLAARPECDGRPIALDADFQLRRTPTRAWKPSAIDRLHSGHRRLQGYMDRDVNKEERRMNTTVVDQDIPELNLDQFKELLAQKGSESSARPALVCVALPAGLYALRTAASAYPVDAETAARDQ